MPEDAGTTPGTVKPVQVSLVEPVACSSSHDEQHVGPISGSGLRTAGKGQASQSDPLEKAASVECVFHVSQGVDAPLARKIVKLIKDKKMKVQAAIQGDQVRVTGKKRDDLQQVIALLKKEELGLPLQFSNFRD